MQLEAEVAATASKYIPAAQAVHRSDPTPAAYVPTLHAVQEIPPELDEIKPLAQAVQLKDPAIDATCPGGHDAHLLERGNGANDPERHSSKPVEPAVETAVPAGAAMQADKVAFPGVGLYVPTGQSVQVDEPGLAEYDPALQGTHDELSVANKMEPNVPTGHARHDAGADPPDSAL